MKRFLPAATIALLIVAVATPVQAGYLIIRIILEGGGSGPDPAVPKLPIGGVIQPPIGVGQPPVGVGQPGGALQTSHDPTRSLVVVVPVEEDLTRQSAFYAPPAKQPHVLKNPFYAPKLHLTLRGEKIVTNLYTDATTIQWYSSLKETPGFVRTHASDVRTRYASWVKSKVDLKAGFNLIVDALNYGMVEEAMGYAKELYGLVQGKKDGIPPEVANFARAYGAMQEALKGAAPKRNNAVETWQTKLQAASVTNSAQARYAMLAWDATDAEIARRGQLLEENFKAFFLWHATRGIELKVPEAPLTVALARQRSDVIPLARALDAPARLTADSFYSAEHDVLVLSPERLDSLGLTFSAQVKDVFRDGITRKELLAGRGPDIHRDGADGLRKPEDVARLQTLALIERLADEQSAVNAISRDGTLQLLYTTGQLPRYVALPDWVSNGAVNFFTRPRDPAFITEVGADKKMMWMMHVAPSPGYGGPNYVLQRQFKDIYGALVDEKKDKKDVAEQRTQRVALLKSLLADAYFLGLRDPKDVNDPDPVLQDKSGTSLNSGVGTGGQPPGTGPVGGPGVVPADPNAPREDPVAALRKKRDLLSVKAQATSWALYYYLNKDRPEELQKFLGELAALPRDLPLDGGTITAAFCRAFKLDGSNASFADFTEKWLSYLRTVPPAGIDIPLVEPASNGTVDPKNPKIDPKNPFPKFDPKNPFPKGGS